MPASCTFGWHLYRDQAIVELRGARGTIAAIRRPVCSCGAFLHAADSVPGAYDSNIAALKALGAGEVIVHPSVIG